MIFALGFFAAGIVALAVAPAFWHRAIRLSTRRLEMELPLSPEEIRASRDLLRAEYAVRLRRLEQKAAALNERLAADMAELGRSFAVIARQDANLRALSEQGSEGREELSKLRQALKETSAELGTAAKEAYDMSGLIARKESRIEDLEASLADSRAVAEKQRETIAAVEADFARQGEDLAARAARIEEVEGEIAALRQQHQAGQATVKAALARVADREEALEASAKREKDLIKHRKLQAEAARAAESGYLEKIERLRSAHAASQEALEASRKTSERLTKELEELRAALSPGQAESLLHREENEILRLKIAELGAAVIRAAGSAPEPASLAGAEDAGEPGADEQAEEADEAKSGEPRPPVSVKATA